VIISTCSLCFICNSWLHCGYSSSCCHQLLYPNRHFQLEVVLNDVLFISRWSGSRTVCRCRTEGKVPTAKCKAECLNSSRFGHKIQHHEKCTLNFGRAEWRNIGLWQRNVLPKKLQALTTPAFYKTPISFTPIKTTHSCQLIPFHTPSFGPLLYYTTLMLETAFWLTGFPINNFVGLRVSLISLRCILILSPHFFLGFPSELPFCSRFRLTKSVCSHNAHKRRAVLPLLQLTALTKFQNTILFLYWTNKTEIEKMCLPKYMLSFHGPKLVLCVSAIYTFTDSDINNINFKTLYQKMPKATGWTILGSTTGRGKIVHAFVQTQPPISISTQG